MLNLYHIDIPIESFLDVGIEHVGDMGQDHKALCLNIMMIFSVDVLACWNSRLSTGIINLNYDL